MEQFLAKHCQNNLVKVAGQITGAFVYSHESFGESFYTCHLMVKRRSNVIDYLPLMISDRIIDVEKNYEGTCINVIGQFRSHNERTGRHNRVRLNLFVFDYEFNHKKSKKYSANDIFLDGYICRPPIYRHTSGGREISDLLVAVNRNCNKSDYLPCICWGRNARFSGTFKTGAHVRIKGRIQSRFYKKYLKDNICENRIAYEISVNMLELLSG